ncbi:glutathione S-transferase family protein [Yunchengibacter salinarum]|uniref:glutathione S-transferase family protein n=1 Tax=Yunchengibacter salinarum TaxID=3133399 RepID=UPI0035B68995
MKLYHFPLSGHAHRAELFLSLIGADYETVPVDLAKGEHQEPDFLALNPFGQVPVLVDGETTIPDSNAILTYLAKKYRRSDWLPETPNEAAQVQRWLSVAAGELANGPGLARLITLFGAPFDPETTISQAHAILRLIDDALEGRRWLVGDGPTIADIALYSYVERAPEGNVDCADYRNIRGWLANVEALPGFVPFPKSAVGLEAAN